MHTNPLSFHPRSTRNTERRVRGYHPFHSGLDELVRIRIFLRQGLWAQN